MSKPPTTFRAWCVYRADGKPFEAKTHKGVQVAQYHTSPDDVAEAVRWANTNAPEGVPHRAVLVKITPITKRRSTHRPVRKQEAAC